MVRGFWYGLGLGAPLASARLSRGRLSLTRALIFSEERYGRLGRGRLSRWGYHTAGGLDSDSRGGVVLGSWISPMVMGKGHRSIIDLRPSTTSIRGGRLITLRCLVKPASLLVYPVHVLFMSCSCDGHHYHACHVMGIIIMSVM
jgi:hypothetical protein